MAPEEVTSTAPAVETPETIPAEGVVAVPTTEDLLQKIDQAEQTFKAQLYPKTPAFTGTTEEFQPDPLLIGEIEHAIGVKFEALRKEVENLIGKTEEEQRAIATEIQGEIERILEIQITTQGEHGEQDRPEAAKEVYDLPPYLEGCFSLLDDPKINWPGWGKDDDVSQEEAVIKQQLLEFQNDPAIQQYFADRAEEANMISAGELPPESNLESPENPFSDAIQAWLEKYDYGAKASGKSVFGNYFRTQEVEELNDTLENEADKIREQVKEKEEKAKAAEAAETAQKAPEAEKPAAPKDKYKEGWSKADKVAVSQHQKDTLAKVNVASGHLNLRDNGDGHPKAWLRKDQEVTILANQEQIVSGVTFVKVSVSNGGEKSNTEGWASLKYLRLEPVEVKQEEQKADVPTSETGGAKSRQRIPPEHPRHIEA